MSQRLFSTLILGLCLAAPSLARAHDEPKGAPKPIPGGREAFQEAAQIVREEYVDPNLSEDELWTGAITGMLDRLIQTKGIKVNALLDPDQMRDMQESMRGQITGVGVVIKKFEGVVFVKDVVAGGPAATAGLKPGDRILAVDKKPLDKLDIAEVVNLIRGPEGTTADLLMQREQNEWTQPLTRKSITVPAVSARLLDGGVGYLRLSSFNENAAAEIDHQLSTTLKSAPGLVLDLRGCPGGLLDSALAVAERFLAPGQRIMVLRGRDGKDDVRQARSKDRGDTLPLVVLVDKDTASSAEILAAALADNARAKLVGAPTLGKGTVERILKLKSGWALKLTVARFVSPSGKSWQGIGLTPDFAIAAPAPEEEGEADDPALRAALAVLGLRR